MNVFLRNSIKVLLLWLLALPCVGWSQADGANVYLTTYVNQPVSHQVSSIGVPPAIHKNATNGVVLKPTPKAEANVYEFTYSPENGFVGVDSFQIYRWLGGVLEFTWIIVDVQPSEVFAVADFAETLVNTAVDIEVLINDESTVGAVALNGISLVNNGAASFEDGTGFISFQPDPDFVGFAYLNYTVCDEMGACGQGTVTINVIDNSVSSQSETRTVFTKKNQSQVVFVPLDFAVLDAPENGSFDLGTNTYVPDQDYIGQDIFTFTDGGTTITVEMSVLDYEEREWATDDRVFTSIGSTVEFNVTDNDASGSSCFQLETQPMFGRIELHGSTGLMTYFPPDDEDFTGVDEFTYSIKPAFCAGEPEIATVEVHVSNFEPSSAKYFMATPKQTPLVISYDIPVSNFGFTIKQQGQLGTAIYLPGLADTMIYDQHITGKNIIVYIPDYDVLTGQDELEIEYCLSSSGGECVHSKDLKVEVIIFDTGLPEGLSDCAIDCVYPGDHNHDGQVDISDLLPLGAAMGEKGKPRPDASMDYWYGQYAEDWEGMYEPVSINLKHLDADGDSIITAFDTAAINRFYGYTHDFIPVRIPTFDRSIRLAVKSDTVRPGDVLEFDLILGSSVNPAIDIYGFTFPFSYNPDFFVAESVQIQFSSNTWLSYNSPILQLSHNDRNAGFLEAGFTRTNGIAASGFGKIAKGQVVITADLEGFRPDETEVEVKFGGGVGSLSNSAGSIVGALVESGSVVIQLRGEDGGELEKMPISEDLLKIYPNPAHSLLNVHLNGLNDFQQVIIHDIAGRRILDTGRMQSNHAQLNVSNLDNGLYFMSVYTEEGVLNKRFEVLKP